MDIMKNIDSTAINVTRDIYNKLQARNTFKLNDDQVLIVDTFKSGKQITTYAQVVYPTDSGFTFTFPQDYMKTVIRKPGRATAKAIADQQKDALDMIDQIKIDAMAFYVAQDYQDKYAA
jgi:hypothetical protein